MNQAAKIKLALIKNQNVFEDDLSSQEIDALKHALYRYLKSVAAESDLFFLVPIQYVMSDVAVVVINELVKHNGHVPSLDFPRISYIILPASQTTAYDEMETEFRQYAINELRALLSDKNFYSSLSEFFIAKNDAPQKRY